MIELNKVSKTFDDKQVLFDISAKFELGTVNLVIGASGGGKSVLLKSMVGLIVPEQGEIFYNGQDFLHLNYKSKTELRKEIGMLFQSTALFNSLTVEENIAFPLQMFSDNSKEEILERVNYCLQKVDLENVNSKLPSEISGGMQKRVGIARAIAMPIKYLFCDEPNSGLDPLTSRLIDELLRDITHEFGITTVINSHDMKTVFDVGEHILFIYNGHNKWEGKRQDINHALKEVPELNEFIQASNLEVSKN